MVIETGAAMGRRIAAWPSLKTDLTNAGAEWVDEEVCVDGNLVTSRKPDDIPAFNREMQKLFARSPEELEQEASEEGDDAGVALFVRLEAKPGREAGRGEPAARRPADGGAGARDHIVVRHAPGRFDLRYLRHLSRRQRAAGAPRGTRGAGAAAARSRPVLARAGDREDRPSRRKLP
jgi:hypothetical protein